MYQSVNMTVTYPGCVFSLKMACIWALSFTCKRTFKNSQEMALEHMFPRPPTRGMQTFWNSCLQGVFKKVLVNVPHKPLCMELPEVFFGVWFTVVSFLACCTERTCRVLLSYHFCLLNCLVEYKHFGVFTFFQAHRTFLSVWINSWFAVQNWCRGFILFYSCCYSTSKSFWKVENFLFKWLKYIVFFPWYAFSMNFLKIPCMLHFIRIFLGN